jgi:hypothetical protein
VVSLKGFLSINVERGIRPRSMVCAALAKYQQFCHGLLSLKNHMAGLLAWLLSSERKDLPLTGHWRQ